MGAGSIVGDTTIVRLDTLTLARSRSSASLERPTTIAVRPDGIALDTLRVRDVNCRLADGRRYAFP